MMTSLSSCQRHFCAGAPPSSLAVFTAGFLHTRTVSSYKINTMSAGPGGPQGGAYPPREQSKRLQQTQAQVDEVVDIMRVNVEKVLERDQKISQLDDRAEALQAGASQFEASAGKLKRKYWWKNLKMMLILGAIIGIIVIIVIVWIVSNHKGDSTSPASSDGGGGGEAISSTAAPVATAGTTVQHKP